MHVTNQPSVRWGYLARESLLILVGSYLFFFAGSHNGMVSTEMLAITAALFTFFWVALILSRPAPRNPFNMPVITSVGALLVSVFFSMDPRRSLSEAWLLCISFLIFLIVTELVQRGWPAELFVKSLLVVGVVFMLLGWGEIVAWYLGWRNAGGHGLPPLNFRLSLPNFYAAALNLLVCLSLARLFGAREVAARVVLLAYALSGLALIFFTSSRGGWVGTAAGLAVLAGLAVRRWPGEIRSIWESFRRRKRLRIVAWVILISSLVAFTWLLYRQTMHPTHVPLFSSRGYLWGPAWQAFLSSPWVGVGPYTFVSLYMGQLSAPPDPIFVYAHSIYLDILSGSGIIGLVAFIWLALSWLRIVMPVVLEKVKPGGAFPAEAAGGLAVLAAFGIHGFFDSVHHTIPAGAWLFAVAIGAAAGACLTEATVRKSGRMRLTVILGLIVVAGAWLNAWTAAPMQTGAQAAEAGDWRTAAEHFTQAVIIDPNLAVAHEQRGLAYAALAADGNDPSALVEARASLQKAAQLDPDWGLNHANLGAVRRAAGDIPGAREAFTAAINAAPNAWLFWLNLGVSAEDDGDASGAKKAFLTALANMPEEMRSADFWRKTENREAAVGAWLAEHPATPAPTLAELELNANSSQMARPHLALAAAYLKLGRSQDAQEQLALAGLGFEKDTDALERQWLAAELFMVRGDRKAGCIKGAEALASYRREGVYGPGHYAASLYAQLMFRRSAMSMELAPQLVTVGLPDVWAEREKKLESCNLN